MTDQPLVRRLRPSLPYDPATGTGAPRGHGAAADLQRQELRTLLEGRYLVGEHESEAEVANLDIAGRTILEIELRNQKDTATSSFDYDPLP